MNITGILLAAGNGTRFGGNKLNHLLPNQKSIGLNSAQKLAHTLDHCVAVVREQDVPFHSDLMQLGFQIVIQTRPDAGMGDSLALAIRASKQADAWLIALADMPWIKIETLQLLIHQLHHGALVTAPEYKGQRGHPVGFNHYFREQLLTLQGDTGAKHLLKNNIVEIVTVNDAGILRDIDRLEDILFT